MNVPDGFTLEVPEPAQPVDSSPEAPPAPLPDAQPSLQPGVPEGFTLEEPADPSTVPHDELAKQAQVKAAPLPDQYPFLQEKHKLPADFIRPVPFHFVPPDYHPPDLVGLTDDQRAELEARRADEKARIEWAWKEAAKQQPDKETALAIASKFGLSVSQVEQLLPQFRETSAATNFDYDKWSAEYPTLKSYVLDNPENAQAVIANKKLSVVTTFLDDATHWAKRQYHDLMRFREGVRVEPGQAPTGLEGFNRLRVLQAQRQVEEEADRAAAAARDAGRTQVEIDDARAAAVRNHPLGWAMKAAVRGVESYRSMEIAQLNHELMMRDLLGQDTLELRAKIQDLERENTPLNLQETPAEQIATDMATGSASSLNMLAGAAKRGGAAGLAGVIVGGTAGAVLTGTPAGAIEGAVGFGRLTAKLGLAEGAVEFSYTTETGSTWKDLENVTTDSGRKLTRAERAGAAMIAGSLKAGLEVLELRQMLSNFGPLTKLLEEGGGHAVKDLLIHDAKFRVLAVKAAKQLVKTTIQETTEEVAQEAVDEAAQYVAVSKAEGGQGMLPGFVPSSRPIFEGQKLLDTGVQGALAALPMGAVGMATQLGASAIVRSQAANRGPRLVRAGLAMAQEQAVKDDPKGWAATYSDTTAQTGPRVDSWFLDPQATVRYYQRQQAEEQAAGPTKPAEASPAPKPGPAAFATAQEALAAVPEAPKPMSAEALKELPGLEEDLGPEGVERLAAALHEGTKLEVPMADVLGRWGKSPAAEALADDTTVNPEHESVNELKSKDVQVERAAERMAFEELLKTGDLDAYTLKLEDELVAADRPRGQAKAVAMMWRHFVETQAERNVLTVPELIARARVSFGLGENAPAAAPKPAAAEVLSKRWDTATRQQRLQDFYQDPITGAFNQSWWKRTEPTATSVADVSIEGIKFENDAKGHQAGDNVYRAAAQALQWAGAQGLAKVGGDFKLANLDEAQLQALLARANQFPGLHGFRLTGAVGKTAAAAETTHRELKRGMERAEPAQRAARGSRPLMAAPEGLSTQHGPITATTPASTDFSVGQAHEAAFDALHPEDSFNEAFVEKDTGLLTELGRDKYLELHPKKYRVSIDVNGVAEANRLIGPSATDLFIVGFGRVMVDTGGHEFLAAHLHGDEYSLDGDDREALQTYVDRLTRVAESAKLDVFDAAGNLALTINGAVFGAGIGEGLDAAEAALNVHKAQLAEQGKRGEGKFAARVDRAAHAGADGGAHLGAGEDARAAAHREDELRASHLDARTGLERGARQRYLGTEARPVPEAERRRAVGAGPGDAGGAGVTHQPSKSLHSQLGMAQARAWVDGYSKQKAKYTAWLNFVDGWARGVERPTGELALTPEQERFIADKFGIVDPQYGYPFDLETARDLRSNVNTTAAGHGVKETGRQTQAQKDKAAVLRRNLGQTTTEGEFGRRVFQRDVGPLWFSTVEKVVQDAKQEKNTPAAWLAVIKKAPGVKQEELDFLGLQDWLKTQKGSVTREALAAFLKENRVEVTEGGTNAEADAAQKEVARANADLVRLLLHDSHISPTVIDDTVLDVAQGRLDVTALMVALGQTDNAEEIRTAAVRLRNAFVERQDLRGTPSQYENYTLGGHTPGSYRELLFYAPAAEGFVAPHFGKQGKGLLAHARISEQTTADGQPLLFVEEIQSDLHQRAREKGYERRDLAASEERLRVAENARTSAKQQLWAALGAEEPYYTATEDGGQRMVSPPLHLSSIVADYAAGFMQGKSLAAIEGIPRERLPAIDRAGQAYHAAVLEVRRLNRRGQSEVRPPNAPFKETYEDLVAKRLIRWAADNGYDKIGWTTGKQQAKRYDLAQHVDELRLTPYLPGSPAWEAGGRYVFAALRGGAVVTEKEISSDDQVAELVGKDLAGKLISETKNNETARVTGQSLQVGGEGMKAAYDQRIPGVFKKLVKKFGGTVQQEPLAGVAQGTSPAEEKFRSIAADRGLRGSQIDEMAQRLKNGTLDPWDEIPTTATSTHEDELVRAAIELQKEASKPAAGEKVWTVSLPKGLLDVARSQGMPLFQQGTEDLVPRGYTDMPPAKAAEKAFRIFLNQPADASTALHETGHVWLELLADLAERPEAPQAVKDDWAATLKWLGVSSRAEIQEEHHEKWARGVEAYVMEGRAPSKALAKVFGQFRRWLMGIYRTVARLGPPLTPEIRGVFDRLLATDEEIAKMQKQMGPPLFKSAEEAGVSQAEWDVQQARERDELEEATARARLFAMKDRARQMDKRWNKERKIHLGVALEEYEQLPGRRAEKLLGNRGHPILLDKAAVEAVFFPEAAPKSIKTSSTGVDPDDVAQLAGFPTGEAMLKALAALPRKEKWATAQADARMEELHPGLLQDRTQLREEIGAALHGENMVARLEREWQALKAPGKPPLEAIKRAAVLIANGKPLGRIGAGAVLAAERRAANGKSQAAARGNVNEAVEFARQQLLNMYVYRELQAARAEKAQVEALAQRLQKKSARVALGKASPRGELRDAVDFLLEAVGLRQPQGEAIDPSILEKAAQVMRSVEVQPGEWLEVLPGVLKGQQGLQRGKRMGYVKWGNFTVAGMRSIHEALRELQKTASWVNEVQSGEQSAEADFIRQKLVEEAVANKQPVGELGSSVSGSTVMELLRQAPAALTGPVLKPETMINWLAGSLKGKDVQESHWYRWVLKPLQDSKVRATDLTKKLIEPILAAWKAMPKDVKKRMTEAIDGAALFPTHAVPEGQQMKAPSRRFELLMMALNAGNDSNLHRLLEGRNITMEQLVRALNLLTKEELDWVQSVWDAFAELKKDLFAMEEEITGLRPKSYEAKPLALKNGTLKGGYFPAIYDRRVEAAGEKQAASAIAQMMDQTFARISTPHSFLKARAEGFSGVIALEPNAVPVNLFQQVHDLAFRRALKNAASLVMHPSVQAVLKNQLGLGRSKQLEQWLKDVGTARGVEGMVQAGVYEKAARELRANVIMAAMGYAVPNMIEDLSNLPASLFATPLKARYLFSAMLEIMTPGKLAATVARVEAMSGTMRAANDQRVHDLTHSIEQLTTRSPLKKGPLGFIRHHAFVLLEASFKFTATQVWLGLYNQSKDENADKPEEYHREFADRAVRRVFPMHGPVDSAGIVRNKGFIGTTLMFYGFQSAALQTTLDLLQQFAEQDSAKSTAGKTWDRVGIFARWLGFMISISVISSFLRGQGPEGDESWYDWFVRKMLTGTVQQAPLGSTAANVYDAVALHKPMSSAERPDLISGVFAEAGKAVMALSDEDAENEAKLEATLRAIGPLVGLPTAQPLRTLKYVTSDSVSTDHPLDVLSGTIYGEKASHPLNPFNVFGDKTEAPEAF